MANPVSQTIIAVGTYVFAADFYANPFNVGWSVDIDSGTVTYTVQATQDAINPVPGVGYGVVVAPAPNWDITVQASGSAAASGNLQTPVQAIRVNVTAISGQITAKFVQPFSIN